MPDQIRYDLLTQKALRGVVRSVLSDAAKKGLPGDHHFYIGFDTHAPRGAPVRAAAGAISGADDHHPAAPVLGPHRQRQRFRGRALLRRHSGEARRSLRRHQQFLRSIGAVRPAIRGRRRRPGLIRWPPMPRMEGQEKVETGQGSGQNGARKSPAHRRPARSGSAAQIEPPSRFRAEARPKQGKPASGGGEVVRLDRFRKK